MLVDSITSQDQTIDESHSPTDWSEFEKEDFHCSKVECEEKCIQTCCESMQRIEGDVSGLGI